MKHAKSITRIGLLTAIICVLAPFPVPIGLVPISLATFAIYLIASVFDARTACAATCAYILLGICGVPVFANFNGGIQVVLGLTGGYILGYVPLALIVSLFTNALGKYKFVYPLSMLLGTAVLYFVGTLQFTVLSGYALSDALKICVIPFLIGDSLKIVLASAVAPTVKKSLIGKNPINENTR